MVDDDRDHLKRILEMGSSRVLQRELDNTASGMLKRASDNTGSGMLKRALGNTASGMLQREFDRMNLPRKALEQAAFGSQLIEGAAETAHRLATESTIEQATLAAQKEALRDVPVPQGELLTHVVAAGQRLANQKGSFSGPQAEFLHTYRALFEQAGAYELGLSFTGLMEDAARLALRGGWEEPYLGSLELAFREVRQERLRPLGILSVLDTDRIRASMSWVFSQKMFAAALLEPADEEPKVRLIHHDVARADEVELEGEFELGHPPTLHIGADIRCALCGNPLHMTRNKFHWHGPYDGILEVEIVPDCSECQRLQEEFPTYFARAMKELKGPTLRVIHGDAEGDGEAAGALWLVPEDDLPEDGDG